MAVIVTFMASDSQLCSFFVPLFVCLLVFCESQHSTIVNCLAPFTNITIYYLIDLNFDWIFRMLMSIGKKDIH